MKKIFLLALALCISAFGEQILNFAVSRNVGPLNPHLYSPNLMFAQTMVYDGLVKYEKDKLVPNLAKSWDISEDGKIYTFHLRNDVFYSNGEKFDAKSVKANFDAILANRKRHSWLELANLIQDVKVKDEFTIELHIKHAYEPTITELSLPRPFRFIAPKAMINGDTKDGIKAPIGTGPYKLVETKLDILDVFERNEKYFAKKPAYKFIKAKVIPDPNTKVIALKTGEIDMIYGNGEIPLESFLDFQKDKKFKTYISKPLLTTTIALNSSRFPSSDLSVRKAVNMALDKEKIVSNLFYNTVKKADFLFDRNLASTNIKTKAYEFNIKKANEILDNDGWILKDGIRYKDGKALKMELIFMGNNASQKIMAEVIQASMKKIGMIIELKTQKDTIFYKKQKHGEFNMIFNDTWGAPYDPISFLAAMRMPSHADYQAQLGMKDKEQIDQMITKILSTLDEEKRNKIIHEVLNKFHEEAIYLPIIYQTNLAVTNDKVNGMIMDEVKTRIRFWDLYPNKK